MALSLSNFLVTLLLLLPNGLLAATVGYDWNITWVQANPDGLAMRPVMGINGQWPLPQLNFTKGDQIVARVTNLLGNESTSIHFHGFFQNGTNDMDGPVGVTQCGIAPGSTFVYNFTVSYLTASEIYTCADMLSVGHPIWHILVSLSLERPVSRWSSANAGHC